MSEEYKCIIANEQICRDCTFHGEFCLTAGERLELMYVAWVKKLQVPEYNPHQLLEDIQRRANERKKTRMKVRRNISHQDVMKLFSHAEDDIWHKQFVNSFENQNRDNLHLLFAYSYEKYFPLVISMVTNPNHRQVDECSVEKVRGIVTERLLKNKFRSIRNFEARDNATFFTYMKRIIYNNLMDCLDEWWKNKEDSTDTIEETISIEDVDEKLMSTDIEDGIKFIQEDTEVINKKITQFYCDSIQEIAEKDFGDGVILYLHFAGNNNREIGEILKVKAADKANNITVTMARHDLKRRFLLLLTGKIRRGLCLEIYDLDMEELNKGDGINGITATVKRELGDQYIYKFSATIRSCLEGVDGRSQMIVSIKRFPRIDELDAPPREIAERVERENTMIEKLVLFLELLPEKMKKYSKIRYVHSIPLAVMETSWSSTLLCGCFEQVKGGDKWR